jgi:hypothetical protein
MRKWQFPDDTTIPANGYLIVWADEDTTARPGLHASFKLGKSGETVYLTDTDSHNNQVLDWVSYGTHTGGFNGEGPASATNLQLNLPNGLWVREDGTVYVLDTGNGRVRSAWPLPTGGLLLLLHNGCQLWYKDASDTMHLLLIGANGRTHAGDGTYFYSPYEWRISEGRSVTMDDADNIIVCKSDYGYVRRIRFERLSE